MKIPNPNPIVLPPKEPKTYPDQWIYNLTISSPSDSDGTVRVELLPYNYETKEILADAPAEVIHINLWESLYRIPEVQQIFGLIIMSIPKLRDFANGTGEFAYVPPIEAPVIEEPQPE